MIVQVGECPIISAFQQGNSFLFIVCGGGSQVNLKSSIDITKKKSGSKPLIYIR